MLPRCGRPTLTRADRSTHRTLGGTTRGLASDVLLRIHEALQAYDGTNYCTVCFAALERRDDTITVLVALGGHLHPLLRRHDGRVELLGHAGTLLGLVPPDTHTTHTRLFPGDVLVVYTDGVTDAPGELAVTVEEFADTISRAGPGPAAIASAIGNLLDPRRPGGGGDDTALLVVEISHDRAAPIMGAGAAHRPSR